MTSSPRTLHRARVTLVLLGLAAPACILDPGGPDYARVGVTATDADGATVFTGCLTLPVLPGSRVEDEWSLGDGVELLLSASRDEVTLRFAGSGQLKGEDLTLTAHELLRGYREELAVDTLRGTELRVRLSSSCEGDEPADGGLSHLRQATQYQSVYLAAKNP